MATPLPLPDDPRLADLFEKWQAGWFGVYVYPRTHWLLAFEQVLREHYPQASSDELTLTARNAAPFYLAQPNVP